MNTVGENIRKFRIYNGMSQKELGDMVGRTSTVISNWENGVHSPDLEMTEELCRTLHVTPSQLLGWEENAEIEAFYENQESILIEIDNMLSAKDILEKRIKAYREKLRKRD